MQNNTPEERPCQVSAQQIALKNAKTALEEAFAPNAPTIQGVTPSNLNSIIEEATGKKATPPISKVIAACNQSSETPAKKKSIEESKKLIENFKDKLTHYPKHLSYEGSVVLCVLLSLDDSNKVNLGGLPQVDRDLILSQLPSDASAKIASNDMFLTVHFDDLKDFVLIYQEGADGETPLKLSFFNTVIHPQKLGNNNVPVEQDGGQVKVGANLVFDKKRIQRLVGATHEKAEEGEDETKEYTPRRQAVAGRNAYEIRSDVLQMAIDWTIERDEYGHKNENDVLTLAKKFYSFVEDKRR